MTDLIPANEDALKTWLIDLAGNIAVSGAGVALLDARITLTSKAQRPRNSHCLTRPGHHADEIWYAQTKT